MAEPKIIIKPATDADFKGIWEIFHEVVKKGDTYSFDPDTNPEEAKAYWMSPFNNVYVATDDKVIVGTYFIRANQPGLGSHVANAAYMVHPKHHGLGIGKAMGLHSLEEARKLGFEAMQFNFVVSTNKCAVELWQKLEFNIIGCSPKAFRHSELGLVDAYIMHRFL